ncbi:hypothetical protein RIR_jg26967.t1 [Rhizophagus irregularis DAOM 181602=DAOM 197198]|nr:hypothetical protein RIR_jg26967.t1 [Rhizophagus irregularis DAOM 181602=DAOM 197198]
MIDKVHAFCYVYFIYLMRSASLRDSDSKSRNRFSLKELKIKKRAFGRRPLRRFAYLKFNKFQKFISNDLKIKLVLSYTFYIMQYHIVDITNTSTFFILLPFIKLYNR